MHLEVMFLKFGTHLEVDIFGPKVGRRRQHLGNILLVEGENI